MNLPVQINGKWKGEIDLPQESTYEAIRRVALNHPPVRSWLEDNSIKNVVQVPGKLVNIVAYNVPDLLIYIDRLEGELRSLRSAK